MSLKSSGPVYIRDRRWDHFYVLKYLTPRDSAKHYYFSKGRLYYTWKPKNVKSATAISFNYETLVFFTGGVHFRFV